MIRPTRKIASVIVGVRPQYIKAAAFSFEFQKAIGEAGCEIEIVDTAQHYDTALSKQIQTDLRISPVFQAPSFAGLTAPAGLFRAAVAINEYYEAAGNPAAMIVFGDANPAFVGAILAAKLEIPLIHIEAGIRRDRHEAEDINCRVTDEVAICRLCATESAVNTLIAEGRVSGTKWVGDITANWLKKRLEMLGGSGVCESKGTSQVLVTIHRPQNCTDDSIDAILGALRQQKLKARWITHPRTKAILERLCNPKENVELCDPLSHSAVLREMMKCDVIVTDSGGLVREAYYLKKPTVLIHSTGYWPELTKLGVSCTVSGRQSEIVDAMCGFQKLHPDAWTAVPFQPKEGMAIATEAILSVINGRL